MRSCFCCRNRRPKTWRPKLAKVRLAPGVVAEAQDGEVVWGRDLRAASAAAEGRERVHGIRA